MPASESLRVVEAYFADHDPRYFAEDAVFDFVPDAEPQRGRDAIAAYLHAFRHDLFSEVENDITNAIASSDTAVVEFTFKGRNTGSMAGMAPTGRRVSIRMIGVYEVDGGEIRSARLYYDAASFLRQLQQEVAPARGGSR